MVTGLSNRSVFFVVCSRRIGFLSVFLFLIACSQSPSPDVQELNPVGQPTFGGSTYRVFMAAASPYALYGECDPASYSLQYSNDEKTWTDVPGSCPSTGTFSISVVFSTRRDVYARAKSKTTYSSTSHALIKLTMPPTSPALMFVSASSSEEGGQGTISQQSAIGNLETGTPASSATHKLHTFIPGINYGN